MDISLYKLTFGFKITSRKRSNSDDDINDRLNHFYAALVLLVLAIFVCSKQYMVGDPIQCWVPPQFPGSWEQYAENYCWVENTYFVSSNETFPSAEGSEREDRELRYYQWIPFVLALQALMFFAPIAFWRMFNWQTGADIKNIVTMANAMTNVNRNDRFKNMKMLGEHLNFTLFPTPARSNDNPFSSDKFQNERASTNSQSQSPVSGSLLSIFYLTTKLLFILNIVLQFVVMNCLFGPNFKFYGSQLISDTFQGRSWSDTGHFPRVTFCDFHVIDVGQTRDFTLQCVLVVNLLSEKIYIFVWFLCVVLLAMNVINFFNWVFYLAFYKTALEDIGELLYNIFIRKRLAHKPPDLLEMTALNKDSLEAHKDSVSSSLDSESLHIDSDEVSIFTSHMRHDAVLVLRLVRLNCGDLVYRDLLCSMLHEWALGRRLSPSSPIGDTQQPTLPRSELPDYLGPSPHAPGLPSSEVPPLSESSSLLSQPPPQYPTLV